MRDSQRFRVLSESDLDRSILYDLLSIGIDAYSANETLHERVMQGLEQDVFQRISCLYWTLSEQLLSYLAPLPQDTGTMNPEPGYIAKAYLVAIKAPIKKAPKRVVQVNKQALQRMRKLAAKLNDRQYAIVINQCLMNIQIVASQNLKHQTGLADSTAVVKWVSS